MKKRILSLMLTMILVVGMIPMTSLPAFAATGDEVYVGNEAMYDGDYLAVGAATTQTTKPSGGYAYYKDGVLTLHDYTVTGYYTYDEFTMEGITGSYRACIYSKEALTIQLEGENFINSVGTDVSGSYKKYYLDGIYCGDNVTVRGTGSLNMLSDQFSMRVWGDIVIDSGTVNIKLRYHELMGYLDCKGLDGLTINGGNVSIDSDHLAVYSISINGGDVYICSGVKAVGGTLNIAEGMKVQASTTRDGALGEYVAANHDSYKKIVINTTEAAPPEDPVIPPEDPVGPPEDPVIPPDPVDPPEDKDNPFVDVTETDWFYDSAMYVYNKGLMTGMTPTTFGPAINLSRAQFAVILWRMNGSPVMEYKTTFPDVPAGTWYTDAVLWANQNGIITGYSHNGHFGSADNITREQMALMMYRYANSKAYDTSKKADFGNFKDAASVSAFAKDGMQWAVGNSIITGKENGTAIDPQGNASRAECATIIMRFMKIYDK